MNKKKKSNRDKKSKILYKDGFLVSKRGIERDSGLEEADLDHMVRNKEEGKIITRMLQKPEIERTDADTARDIRRRGQSRKRRQTYLENAAKKAGGSKYFDNTVTMMERGMALKFMREASGLSREEFCLLAGTSLTYLSQIENGRRSGSLGTLDYWMELLGGRIMVIPVMSKRYFLR